MRKPLALLIVLSAACSAAPGSDPDPRPRPTDSEHESGAASVPSEAAAALAGARIEAAEPRPSRVDLTRGDTIEWTAVFRDAEGQPVTGARWGITTPSGVLDGASVPDTEPKRYRLRGVAPGEGTLRIWVQVATRDGFGWKPVGEVPVRVREWPAERIVLASPAYAPYAGSVFPLAGRVITDHGTEHATARITWSSDDPEIVAVTSAGLATFRRPGVARVRAEAEGIRAAREIEVLPNPVARVVLEATSGAGRTGDVVRVRAGAEDRAGRAVEDAHVAYSVVAVEGPRDGAVVFQDGAFVAEEPGTYRVMATAADRTSSVTIEARPRHAGRPVERVGRGRISHVTTSDLWVFEGRDGRDYAYTGTWAEGGGQRMFVWDVSDPASPVLMDSVVVDARVVNDVKVNDDVSLAVITRENASDRRNGIVILNIREPAHPVVLSTFTEGLTGGVHNAWIHGDLVYAVHNGTAAMHIIDVSEPRRPTAVGRWEIRPGDPEKYLHDVWVKDGLAYLSYWDDGLVILDAGAGIEGGTAREPKFVSRISYPTGNTHVAYRYGDYVFVGDEILQCGDCLGGPRGPRGYIHVIDVSDIRDPEEVARFEVPEAGAHNIWVEDGRMYVAYYQGGLRVVDVSGELRGDLYAQGRQIGWYHTAAAPGEGIRANAPMAWGPQLFKGHVFVSDMNSGLWVLKVGDGEPRVP